MVEAGKATAGADRETRQLPRRGEARLYLNNLRLSEVRRDAANYTEGQLENRVSLLQGIFSEDRQSRPARQRRERLPA